MRKKKVVIHSNFCLAKTGFGRHSKLLLSYLYKTGKYDLVEYAAAPITWSGQICKSMPWKTYGALPDNEKELDPYRGDENHMRAIMYGELNINKVIQAEKPDAIIMIEDIWGIGHSNKPWNNKITTVYWTPIDSLPLLPVFEHNKDKFENLWVKAKFAKSALEEKGIKSEFMPALIDYKDFKILSEDQKDSIRKKFGIAKDTIVFGFVFRNQLRKLVGTLIEAFSIFKAQNPNIDAKLFLHTNWTEQQGWRIPEFMERFGVKREDVITTHVCYNCKDVSVKPFYGNEAPCRKCRSEKSVNTPSVDVGVTEKELCEIYNMCDAYIHPATSGGFEMPVLEAMLCGLPVATTDYSYGRDFTENNNVYPLKYTIYNEGGSHFDKAQVHTDSIVDFMVRISNMSKEDRSRIGQNLREWATEIYDHKKVCKKIEDFLDSIPYTDYDFNFSNEKNENYPMPDIADNKEFILDLYKNILGVDVENNPGEFNSALALFNQGMNQQQVYERFVNVARDLNKKNKQIDLKDLLENNGKKRLLFVEPGGLADCVDSLAVLNNLTNSFLPEEWDFYVASAYPEMFEHLPFLTKNIPYDPFLEDVLAMEGIDGHDGFFDVAFHAKKIRTSLDYYKNNFYVETTSGALRR